MKCLPCGLNGRGRCYGPDICCNPDGGCLFKTRETLVCRLEALNPHLCKVPGLPCGSNGTGNCGSEGICCTSESCSEDKTCSFKRDSLSLADSYSNEGYN